MSPHLTALTSQKHGFAAYPEIWIRKTPQSNGSTTQHLLFGDYISPPKKEQGTYEKWSEAQNQTVVDGVEWLRVRSREVEGWVKAAEVELSRILEVNFVDVGQGDGCHIVTPADEHYIIDAGVSDNMFRFIKWRFNLGKPGKEAPAFTAIISHPDKDHFYGFKNLFDQPEELARNIMFKEIFHNGLVQQADSYIGEEIISDGVEYRTIIESDAQITEILDTDQKRSQYEEILKAAKDNFPGLKISMLCRKHPSQSKFVYNNNGLIMEVLAPIPEMLSNGRLGLRWFGDVGKTKNGHSVILKLSIGHISVLLGGDLNTKAADFLMEQYSGKPMSRLRAQLKEAKDDELENVKSQLKQAVESCRPIFQCHVAKSCHHGSHDITNEFLDSVNPIATIISSGDEESHSHPRPETLGAIGKFSRGERPLVYSTELARSSPEYIKLKKQDYPNDNIKERIVITYGMINLRTDGERVIIAQKLEKSRSNYGKLTKWQIEKLVWNEESRDFEYKGK